MQSSETLLGNARALRKNQTLAEKILWQHLRNKKLNGYKFRRQHPLQKGFVLDFYCAEARIAIEVDGEYHSNIEQREQDEGRTYEIIEYDIKVLRFWNEEVLNNIDFILNLIENVCSARVKNT